ncbi:uncharacterized protein LOC120706404 [Panicum virgatum]|uniref:F-box/LRR-repeat protein 15/At3g58940/PEG3-like LRR domain-containing protein n=1 Tax=Panicum virgatum TaxID=38727 RepID=A0A8T0SBF1_PANVG|nr:uncharacterized protein LOC120706404 [Panicum virgatum]KAG2596542.1 hypothetical protein PVAP13_5KG168300 [Panicum virgatum]
MDILDCQDCRTTMLVGLLQLRLSFRTTSCMASTGIYCAALCTLRCCTLVHIHPKLHRANDFPRHINRTHHPQRRQEPSMESHHTSKRRAMAAAEDRLSGLPDDLLHSILRGLPLKHAARTSALSRWWARQWLRALASSPAIDFTDRDFARGQPPARAAATVSRYLKLHAEYGAPLSVFRVALGSGDAAGAFGRDVVGWVAAAVARGARDVEVEVDLQTQWQGAGSDLGGSAFLELPGDLFLAKNALERLALGGFGLRAVPPGAAGLAGLRSLSLSDADVTDQAVRAMVSNCGALESLSLRRCRHLTSVRIAGEKLRVLELVGCLAVRKQQVAAPALESFAFHGDVVCSSDPDEDDAAAVHFGDTPALRDAYLSHLDSGDYDDDRHDFAYPNFLECIAHANILTLCSVGLLHIDVSRGFAIGFDAPNLQELQLLMPSLRDDDVERVSACFEFIVFPILDRLFIRLLGEPADASGAAASPAAAGDDKPDIVPNVDILLDHLTLVKVVNIRGTRCELRLLRFLMNRAPALEQLVLVTVEEEGALGGEEMEAIQTRVLAMRTASPEARVTVCRPGEDGSRNPAHRKLYHEQ